MPNQLNYQIVHISFYLKLLLLEKEFLEDPNESQLNNDYSQKNVIKSEQNTGLIANIKKLFVPFYNNYSNIEVNFNKSIF